MSVESIETPILDVNDLSELAHFACCCSPWVSLCTMSASDYEVLIEWDGVGELCVVCGDLEDVRCPQCGYDNEGPECWCGNCFE